jgi:hypothetical protein
LSHETYNETFISVSPHHSACVASVAE